MGLGLLSRGKSCIKPKRYLLRGPLICVTADIPVPLIVVSADIPRDAGKRSRCATARPPTTIRPANVECTAAAQCDLACTLRLGACLTCLRCGWRPRRSSGGNVTLRQPVYDPCPCLRDMWRVRRNSGWFPELVAGGCDKGWPVVDPSSEWTHPHPPPQCYQWRLYSS